MKNFYQVVQAIKTVADAHPQVKDFYYGSHKVNSKQDNAYPIVNLDALPATINKGTIDFSFNLTVLGMPEINRENNTDYFETDSLTFDILFDLIAELKMGITKINTTDREITLQEDITTTPIQATNNDKLNGWSASIVITVPHPKNGCSDSIINITN